MTLSERLAIAGRILDPSKRGRAIQKIKADEERKKAAADRDRRYQLAKVKQAK